MWTVSRDHPWLCIADRLDLNGGLRRAGILHKATSGRIASAYVIGNVAAAVLRVGRADTLNNRCWSPHPSASLVNDVKLLEPKGGEINCSLIRTSRLP